MYNLISLTRSDDGHVVLSDVQVADTFWARFRGLMGRAPALFTHSLLIEPCSSVHTCFMRFPIDVVFLSESGLVLRTLAAMKPWRFSPVVVGAKSVLECPVGTIESCALRPGDVVVIDGRPIC